MNQTTEGQPLAQPCTIPTERLRLPTAGQLLLIIIIITTSFSADVFIQDDRQRLNLTLTCLFLASEAV